MKVKDPLQTQATPYEILGGISPDATDSEIHDAFNKTFAKGNVKQKQDARQFLLNRPLDRALLNLFLYDDAVLEKLDPNPLNDPGALDISRRAETAKKWRKQFRGSTFPDPGIAHALGILWYWSACQASEQFAETGEQSDGDMPVWQDSWESAMGYWAFVTTTPHFWAEKSPPSSLTQDDIRAGVQQRITSDLHRFTQLQRDAGHDDAADLFQQLEMDLTRELETAKTLLDANARSNDKFICFGNLMLARMRLVEQIVAYIDKRLLNPPPSATKEHLDLLRNLKEALSPYGKIATLIRNGRFEAALDEIERLPPNERELPEILGFEAQARFPLGQQLASVGKLDKALTCWERALQCTQSDNLRREIAEAAESACIDAAAKNPPRDEAIGIFESGLRIAPHSEKLRLGLADRLMQRGAEAVIEAQKKIKPNDEGTIRTAIRMIEPGIADFKRAKELGSERAAEQLKVALEVHKQLRQFRPLPPGVDKLLEEVKAAAERGNWDETVKRLRKIIRQFASWQVPNQIRKDLAVCLTKHGIDRFNVAQSEMFQILAAAMNTPLTPQGLGSLRDMLIPIWKSLYIACATLCEAIQLDPSNENILTNLRGIEKEISQLESVPAQFQPNDRQKHSVSAETVRLLQEGYAALENEYWDQAAEKFGKAINQLGSEASEHLPREFPISAEAQQLLDEAYAARERKDWDEAIEKLRKATNRLGSRTPEQAKKDLADLLAQRGINRQNEVMQTPGLTGKERASKLYPARDDLLEAKQLDPSNYQITKRLDYIEEVIQTLRKGGTPRPPPQPPQPIDKKLIEKLMERFSIKPWALIAFHLFMFLLAFGVASYNQGSLFFYEIDLPPDQWLSAFRNGSTLGNLAVSSATPVSLIGIFLLIFSNWFSWKTKLPKAIFFIIPEAVLFGWLVVFFLGLMHMPTTDSDQKWLSSKVVTDSAVTASAKNRISEKPIPKIPMESNQQFLRQEAVVDQITTALIQLDGRKSDSISNQKLRTEIDVLQKQLPLMSNQTRSAAALLIAAALEKLGDQTAARSYYAKLIEGGDSYIVTGRMRRSELDASNLDQLENAYKKTLEKPATEGWFRTAGLWEQTTAHRAANLGLADLRKDKISIRLLDWLRSKSLFPLPYAYLFALTVLAIVLGFIKLPLLVTMLRINNMLKPEVDYIRENTAKNSNERNTKIAELYKNHGVNGFGLLLIDIAFAIWIVLSLRAWAPQMELDGSKFFWITDIFQPSYSALIVYAAMGVLLAGLVQKKLTHDPDDPLTTLVAVSMGLPFIIPAIAWFFDWPAYMVIAWMVLWGISAGIQLVPTKLDLDRFSRKLPPKADFVCKTN